MFQVICDLIGFKLKCFKLYGTSKVSHQPATCHGHIHCGSGDILILVFHVVLKDHVIKGSHDFMIRSPYK